MSLQDLSQRILTFSQELAKKAEENKTFVSGQLDALERVRGEIDKMLVKDALTPTKTPEGKADNARKDNKPRRSKKNASAK